MYFITDQPGSAEPADIGSLRLGQDKPEIALESREDSRQLAQALASQAGSMLLLHTDDLEPPIFDQAPFLDAVSQLVLGHRDASFRILIQDGRRAVQQQHRLIELARRLSSHIQFRRPTARYRDYHQTFLLADDAGYLHRPFATRYEGTASFNNPGKVQDLRKYFMEVWEHSEPDEELRRLHL